MTNGKNYDHRCVGFIAIHRAGTVCLMIVFLSLTSGEILFQISRNFKKLSLVHISLYTIIHVILRILLFTDLCKFYCSTGVQEMFNNYFAPNLHIRPKRQITSKRAWISCVRKFCLGNVDLKIEDKKVDVLYRCSYSIPITNF